MGTCLSEFQTVQKGKDITDRKVTSIGDVKIFKTKDYTQLGKKRYKPGSQCVHYDEDQEKNAVALERWKFYWRSRDRKCGEVTSAGSEIEQQGSWRRREYVKGKRQSVGEFLLSNVHFP